MQTESVVEQSDAQALEFDNARVREEKADEDGEKNNILGNIQRKPKKNKK